MRFKLISCKKKKKIQLGSTMKAPSLLKNKFTPSPISSNYGFMKRHTAQEINERACKHLDHFDFFIKRVNRMIRFKLKIMWLEIISKN
jgi:hypothetical protein